MEQTTTGRGPDPFFGQSPTSHACIVFGGGGHGKVVLDALLAGGLVPQGVLDRDRSRWGTAVLGVRILGGEELLAELVAAGTKYFCVGVGSTGDASVRRRLFQLGLSHGLIPFTVRHPSSICSPSAKLGAGAQLLAGSVVNPCATIDENAIINTAAVVEHDCHVGKHVHVAPGSRLGGHVHVGDCAHIGIGATVRQGIRIGDGAVVGAGAVVVDDVADRVVVTGVPARIHKKIAA